MPRRADPRYEITPVTPRAARKKFEGVVAGAWKPFVSLSLRRFVHQPPYIPPSDRSRAGSSFSLSGGHQINHGLSSLAERFTYRGYIASRSLPQLIQTAGAAVGTIRNGLAREFRTYGMHFCGKKFAGEEQRKSKKRTSTRDGRGSGSGVEEEDERVARFSWILMEHRVEATSSSWLASRQCLVR